MNRRIDVRVAKVAIKATKKFLLAIVIAIILYHIVARLLSWLTIGGEELIRDVDNMWLFTPIAYGLSVGVSLVGLRYSYNTIKNSGWRYPRYILCISLLGGASVALFSMVFLSFSGAMSLLLLVIVYGLMLYGTNIHKNLHSTYIIGAVFIIFGLSLAAYITVHFRAPNQTDYTFLDTILLPDPSKQSKDPWQSYSAFELPTDVSVKQKSPYGKALVLQNPGAEDGVYPAHLPVIIYQMPVNAWTRSESCPNIRGTRTYGTTNCTRIGSIDGVGVYAATHYITSDEIYEVFFQFGSTVVSFHGQGIDAQGAIQYLKTLRRVEANQMTSELAANKDLVSKLVAKEKQRYATVAERLPFNPLLHGTLPEGWASDEVAVRSDFDHPKLQELSYYNEDYSLRITAWHQDACQPVTSAEFPVRCYDGSSYHPYVDDEYTRYMFRRVGDTIAVVQIHTQQSGVTAENLHHIMQAASDILVGLKQVQPSDLPSVRFY